MSNFLYPGLARERLLSIGRESSGKTKDYFDIAVRLSMNNPANTVYILDLDNTTDRFLDAGTYGNLGVREKYLYGQVDQRRLNTNGNIVIFQVKDWEGITQALSMILPRIQADDWLVIDSMSLAWDWIKDWYSEKVYGKGLAEFLLMKRVEHVGQGGDAKKQTAQSEQFLDYEFINSMWNEVLASKLLNAHFHVYMTAEVSDYDPSRDKDEQAISLYGQWRVKPRTQKRVGFMAHTLLFKTKVPSGEFRVSTIKDRERQLFINQTIGVAGKSTESDFTVWYLNQVGGWGYM